MKLFSYFRNIKNSIGILIDELVSLLNKTSLSFAAEGTVLNTV
tara:strand:+ start:13642 stop:13770 length:129 start_codon:yes stop_codon:yes gene_type:complete